MVSMWQFPIDQEDVVESTGLDPYGWDPAQEGPLQGKNTLLMRYHGLETQATVHDVSIANTGEP